jgi:hypothetical protein
MAMPGRWVAMLIFDMRFLAMILFAMILFVMTIA